MTPLTAKTRATLTVTPVSRRRRSSAGQPPERGASEPDDTIAAMERSAVTAS